jgi:hypothetical protein
VIFGTARPIPPRPPTLRLLPASNLQQKPMARWIDWNGKL